MVFLGGFGEFFQLCKATKKQTIIRNEDIRKEAHVIPVEVVWPLLEARTQPHLCEIAKTGSFGEKELKSADKEINNGRACTRGWSRKVGNNNNNNNNLFSVA